MLGTLPVLCYEVVEACPLPFTPFGALRTPDGVHHKLGVSVNGLLRDLIRIDVTTRLDRRVYSIGVSLLRFL